MLPTLVIFFRESLEASLIVAIILAYLRRLGRSDAAVSVWLGVGGALALDLLVALLTYHLIRSYDGSRTQTILEGTTYLVATVLLTGMSFWMKRQSKGLRRELEERVQAALSQGSLAALALLAAVTVGREGLETVFFTLAVAFTTPGWGIGGGALLGMGAGLAISYAIYHAGRRVPLGLFFNILGVLLLLFAAGLLADGVQDLQSLGWLPFLTHVVWHTQGVLNEESTLGDILHSFFGYADQPTVLQLGAYLAFLLTTVCGYTGLGRRLLRPAEGQSGRAEA